MACVLTSPSPFGDAISFVTDQKICRQQILGHEAPISRAIGFHHSETRSIKWSTDATQCLVTTDSGVKVLDSLDLLEKVCLESGTGGLGKIATAEFAGSDKLLITWDFGKTKLWDLTTGKALDLADLKTTTNHRMLQIRARCEHGRPDLVAMVSRNGTDDVLHLQFLHSIQLAPAIRLATIDAQSLSWSPDGRWLAVLDVPTAASSLHIYTPDGNRFRSYPAAKAADAGLGVKSVVWSPDGTILALSHFDASVELLNTRTFSPIAVVEHSLRVDQTNISARDQALIWQEAVSASNERSYTLAMQPFSPPLTRTKASMEPSENGVAELRFSCSGRYLATRDCRMLNSVWIWDMATLSAHAVIVQHNPVRELLWHPSRADTLMMDCADGVAAIYEVSSRNPPVPIPTMRPSRATLSWIHTAADAKLIVLVTEKTTYRFLFPEGQDDAAANGHPRPVLHEASFDEGASDDSLFDLLSNRKPLPPKTEPSYTEMVDVDVDAEDTMDAGLDDTFRGKRRPLPTEVEVDPLDDSEIF